MWPGWTGKAPDANWYKTMLPKRVVLTALVALAATALGGEALGAEALAGTIEKVHLSSSSGFVYNEASFKEVGAGSSRVAVWIEVYDGSSGPLKSRLARKSGTSACRAGRTCFTHLRTLVEVLRGECYVGRASTSSGGASSEQRSPASGRLCP